MATAIEYSLIAATISTIINNTGAIVRLDGLGRPVSQFNPMTGEYIDANGIRSYRSANPHLPTTAQNR